MKIKSKHILLLSMVIFLCSLIPNPYVVNHEEGELFGGFFCVTIGLFGFWVGGPFLSWLANPLLFVSWFLSFKKKYKWALITSLIAIAFGLYFLSFDEILVDEAGHRQPITSYDLGYYLWILSMVVCIFGNALGLFKRT